MTEMKICSDCGAELSKKRFKSYGVCSSCFEKSVLQRYFDSKNGFHFTDLVQLENRKKLINSRRDKLLTYKWSRLHVEYENGIAARMYINPYIKSAKADKIIKIIDKEITSINSILKHFK